MGSTELGLVIPLPAIYAELLKGLFGFARIGTFIAVMPLFSAVTVPGRVRLIFALAITVAAWSHLPEPPAYQDFSLAFFLAMMQQVVIGAMLGFPTQLFFQSFVMAAQIIALQMGLGFASMLDPEHGVSVTVLAQFYYMLVALLFLAMGGHLLLVQVAVESFRFWPNLPWSSAEAIVGLAGFMFSTALLVSLPAVTALLMVNLGLGVLTRAAPQLNIFSIGFPATLVLGVVVVWMSTAGFVPQFTDLTDTYFRLLDELMTKH